MEINLQDDKQQEDQEYTGKIFWECRAKEYYVAFFFASNIIYDIKSTTTTRQSITNITINKVGIPSFQKPPENKSFER